MSAHFKDRPTLHLRGPGEPEPTIGTPMNGGLFISEEQLARIDPDPSKARRILRVILADAKKPKTVRGPTAKPKEVRIAMPEDEDVIVALALMDLKENAESVAPIAEEKVRDLVRKGVHHKDGVIIGVIDGPENKPVAMQIIVPETWWWSNSAYLCKVVDFVHPAHRKSDHAKRLIQFAKWAADFWTTRFGYRTYVLSGVLATKRVRGKVRLYAQNMTPIGGYFLYPTPALMDESVFPLGDF